MTSIIYSTLHWLSLTLHDPCYSLMHHRQLHCWLIGLSTSKHRGRISPIATHTSDKDSLWLMGNIPQPNSIDRGSPSCKHTHHTHMPQLLPPTLLHLRNHSTPHLTCHLPLFHHPTHTCVRVAVALPLPTPLSIPFRAQLPCPQPHTHPYSLLLCPPISTPPCISPLNYPHTHSHPTITMLHSRHIRLSLRLPSKRMYGVSVTHRPHTQYQLKLQLQ